MIQVLWLLLVICVQAGMHFAGVSYWISVPTCLALVIGGWLVIAKVVEVD